MSRRAPLRRAFAGAAVATLVVGLALWWTAPALLVRGASQRLDSFLPLLTRLLANDLDAPSETLQPRVRALTRGSDLRVTVIGGDGLVVADSERTLVELAQMDNHSERPEVRQALELGRGESRRRSRTTGLEYVYLARRVPASSGEPYILRLAQPLHQVPLGAAEQLGLVLLPLAAAALLGGAFGWWADRRHFRPLRRLSDSLAGPGRRWPETLVEGPERVAEIAAGIDRATGKLRRRLAELERERDELLGIVEAMSDGVLVADAEQRVELVNPVFGALFATRPAGAGQTVLELSRSPALAGFIEDLAATDEVLEARIDSEAGRTLLLRGRRSGGGRAVVMARDLSEQVRLDETRRDLVANVSHELRTPLTAIRGYAENLKEGALGEPAVARRFLDRILVQCNRLEALLQDLLALSRLERNAEEAMPNRRRVDLGRLAEQAIETVRGLAAERRVEIELRAPAEAPVEASVEALERMLLNLLDNAIKYNRSGGSVTVTVKRRNGDIELAVADTGLGVPQRDLPRIFERFYRVDSGRSREEGGTGLGLAIVKHAAQLCGGRVEVDSELGRGSVFRVYLPASDG